jgi:hypothetical protein
LAAERQEPEILAVQLLQVQRAQDGLTDALPAALIEHRDAVRARTTASPSMVNDRPESFSLHDSPMG